MIQPCSLVYCPKGVSGGCVPGAVAGACLRINGAWKWGGADVEAWGEVDAEAGMNVSRCVPTTNSTHLHQSVTSYSGLFRSDTALRGLHQLIYVGAKSREFWLRAGQNLVSLVGQRNLYVFHDHRGAAREHEYALRQVD